jgi:signal transduction histidine kinase
MSLSREDDEIGGDVGYASNMSRLDRLRSAIEQHPLAFDAAIAGIMWVLSLLTLKALWPLTHQEHPVRAVLITSLALVLLIWRRRYPLAVLAVMSVVFTVGHALNVPESEWWTYSWAVAFYSAGVYGSARYRDLVRLGAVTTFLAVLIHRLFFREIEGFDEGNLALLQTLSLAANLVAVIAVWWFSDAVRVRRAQEAQLAETVVQLELDRQENARRAVFDERVRIARELHDVVAHHVSVMGVQAGAARRVLQKHPEKAEQALSNIEVASREAVQEMHRLLGFLRQEPEDTPFAPQPGMSQLTTLVDQMRDAGLPVELQIEGTERTLPPSVDLSAYRIVQEALTNTLRHAGPARAQVKVSYADSAIDIEVLDDGRGPNPGQNGAGTGHGLIGMRERVTLLGGTFQAGHHPGVGYSVRAHLPLDGTPA